MPRQNLARGHTKSSIQRLLNMPKVGPGWDACPQRHLHLLLRNLHYLPYQHRQLSRIQCHHFPQRCDPSLLLHHIHFLHLTQMLVGRSSSVPMAELGKVGSSSDCHCCDIPRLCIPLFTFRPLYMSVAAEKFNWSVAIHGAVVCVKSLMGAWQTYL